MATAMIQSHTIDFRVRVPPALCPKVDTPAGSKARYNEILSTDEKFATAQTLEDLLQVMDNNGIEHAVMHAEYEFGDSADVLNRVVAEVVAGQPQRFSGIGTISQQDFSIKKALRQVDDCIEMGFLGLSIQPAFFGMALDEKVLYPIYAKAMENNLLVALHTGINYTSHRPMSGENPILLDNLACDFPDLTIVASHAGWPWITEMVAVARKHPNVFMEFGGLAPKYIGAPGSGWETMFRFMNSVLSKQVLYGTDWPTMDHQRTLAEWRALGLKPEVLADVLAGNASTLISQHTDTGLSRKISR